MDSPPPPPPLRRRNSISTSVVIPTKLTVPYSKPLHTTSLPNGVIPSSPPTVDFDLASLNSSLNYTSLKDILPSTAVNSPTAASAAATPSWGAACEISIRNRLVKHAAWAYLQPMSSSPGSSGSPFLRRFWLRFCTHNPIAACLRFINLRVIPTITGAFNRILRAVRVRMNR